MTENCECCKKELPFKMGNQRYCNTCSLHKRDLKREIHKLRQMIRSLEREVNNLILKVKGRKKT